MVAKIKTWYSIRWQILDYSKKAAFEEILEAPKFFFVEDYIPSLRIQLEETYQNLFIDEIFETKIFVEKDGQNLPTHYRAGMMQPGDNPRYDQWLSSYHEITLHEIQRIKERFELNQSKIFLEYSNKVIRHDMHSGINTYIPRGLAILKKRLTSDVIKENKIELGLTLIEKGLSHAQGVYEGVRSFTSMVREGHTLERAPEAIDELLRTYFKMTAYSDKIVVHDLPQMEVNKSLFCSAINVFARNGLTFNKSKNKKVEIYFKDDALCIEDNGIGLTQEQFDIAVYPKKDPPNVEGYDNMDMNIAMVIMKEHGLVVKVEEKENGTILRIIKK